MPASLPIRSLENLRVRVVRFLTSSKYGLPEVRALLSELAEIGEVVLFGGVLRDLSLIGTAGFCSDVDVVVSPNRQRELDAVVGRYCFTRNKFGGFRIALQRWSVDIWTIQSTWAFEHGYVKSADFAKLPYTTFFDWDAIAFDLRTKQFYAIDSYVQRINSRVLDINLADNPNPLGNVVRALRYCEKYDAALSARLARYVQAKLEVFGAEAITTYERRSWPRPVLSETIVRALMSELHAHQASTPIFPFQGGRLQRDLLSLA